nr:immunoglobulin heavy chain junction region [Mus musculus]
CARAGYGSPFAYW